MDKKDTNIFVKIIRTLSYIFLVFLCLIAIFLVFYIVTSAIAKKNNTKPPMSMYTIVSPSMEPTIMVYDVIVNTNPKSDNDLDEGTIITFYSDSIDTGGYTVTHRIYKKYNYNNTIYYETKGDNNVAQDVGRITFGNIVGKYLFKIPGLGKLQFFVTSKVGWVLIILLPALIIILSDVFKLKNAKKIKENLDDIENNPINANIEEQERDKKIRALIEKADKINKK